MRRLIVNADDFGLTSGVNRGIIELHAAGLVTSTSLMARSAAADEAIQFARSAPSLGVGCHVVLVDGEPALPPAQIPTVVDPKTGSFHVSLAAFLSRLFTGRIRAGELEAEAAAQIATLQSRGLRLTHIDTHKHLHVFPQVLRPLLRAARAAGIHAIRHPFEPAWAVRGAAKAPLIRIAELSAMRWLEPRSRKILSDAGFRTTDGTIAMAGTGSLDPTTLRALLKRLPAGTWELVTHPGYNDADLAHVRTRLRASRDLERQILAAVREFPSISLISYADLTGRDF